jgi:hypothetical protein
MTTFTSVITKLQTNLIRPSQSLAVTPPLQRKGKRRFYGKNNSTEVLKRLPQIYFLRKAAFGVFLSFNI